jgi:hypothetical protein
MQGKPEEDCDNSNKGNEPPGRFLSTHTSARHDDPHLAVQP